MYSSVKTSYTWVENSAQETCLTEALSKSTPKWNIALRPSGRQKACSWSLCWRPLLSVTCIHWSERDSFLLLLHLSRWNVPLHSRGGGYQNNLAYIPWITQWSMCIELRGNNDPTEKKKKKLGWEVFSFPTPQWDSRMIKKVIEREKQSFDAAQPNKPKSCFEV